MNFNAGAFLVGRKLAERQGLDKSKSNSMGLLFGLKGINAFTVTLMYLAARKGGNSQTEISPPPGKPLCLWQKLVNAIKRLIMKLKKWFAKLRRRQ